MEKKVNMYIETETKAMKKMQRKYGIVLECEIEGEIYTRQYFHKTEGTYNQVIMMAITNGLKNLKEGCEVEIWQSNDFVTTMIDSYLDFWKKNGFLTTKGEPIKNQDEWKALGAELDKHKIAIETVVSHQYSNWMLNEMKKVDNYVDNSQQNTKQ